MDMVNYYIPSEFQVFLEPHLSLVKPVFYRYLLSCVEDGALWLCADIGSKTASIALPDTVSEQINELAQRRMLTNASVYQILSPYRQQLIQKIGAPDVGLVNLSQIFSAARGYVIKNDTPVAVFASGALHLDTFNDICSLSFTLPVRDTDHVILLTSAEYATRENEPALFTAWVDGTVYQIMGISRNTMFRLQHITTVPSMLHQPLFKDNRPLPEIYTRFSQRPTKFGAMLRRNS